MSISPSLRDLLWEAVFGARWWFLTIFGIGCGLIALSLVRDSDAMTKAYAFAFLMPFLVAALMGTASIWVYRTRFTSRAFSPTGRLAILAAAIWNCGLFYLASSVEQILTRTSLLARPPTAFLEAVTFPLAAGLVVTCMVALPNRQ